MKKGWTRYIRLAVTAFVIYFVIHYWSKLEGAGSVIFSALLPLVVGAVIAYIVNIPMTFFERSLFGRLPQKPTLEKAKRPVCILLAIAAVVGVIFLVFAIMIPRLASCVNLLIEKMPPVISEWYNKLDARFNLSEFFNNSVRPHFGDINDWRDLLEKMFGFVTTGVGGVMGSVFTVLSVTFSVIFTTFVSVAFALYLLAGKERIGQNILKVMDTYLKREINEKARRILTIFNDCFHRFFVGQFTEAILLGLLCFIGMMIFRFPAPSMIGTLVGFTALIPFVGAYIGALLGAFIVATEDSLIKAVLFLVFIIILQQLENNLIYPKVVGASIGLPGIWVLAAITIGGTLCGIAGMLVSVPFAAALYRLLRDDVARRNEDNTPPAPPEVPSETPPTEAT